MPVTALWTLNFFLKSVNIWRRHGQVYGVYTLLTQDAVTQMRLQRQSNKYNMQKICKKSTTNDANTTRGIGRLSSATGWQTAKRLLLSLNFCYTNLIIYFSSQLATLAVLLDYLYVLRNVTLQLKLDSTGYSALPSPPRITRPAVDTWYKRLSGHTHSVRPSATIPSLAKRRRS